MDYNYVGKTLDGRYEIQEVLGVGGMAIVYRAYDNIDDLPVAVKILKDEYLANEEFRRRFKNESKAIAMLSHPNIVKVYDVSYGERLQYIVMEYVEGITLKEYIEQRRAIPWKEAVHFLTQILRALQHAHDRGVVHRDIKPQNIMLLHSGNIKVTDFGIARFSRSETRTMTENAIGSVHYISPEQARGDFTDGKTDIYSLGVVLYEMLTGELPFQSDSTVSVAIMQLQSEPRRPRELNDQIPVGLEQITIHAMQKSPAERYQSAAEMLLDLEEFKRNPIIRFEYSYFVDQEPMKYVPPAPAARPPHATTTIPALEQDEPEGRNRSVGLMVGIVGGIVGLLILAGLLFWFVSSDDTITVHNFVGMTQVQVQAEMSNFGRIYRITYESGQHDDFEPGQIFRQDPPAGARVAPEEDDNFVHITLWVVEDSATLRMPDVRNMPLAEAEAQVREAGLRPQSVTQVNRRVPEGEVISTDPVQGSAVQLNQQVTLYVAIHNDPEDEITMPDITGFDVDIARELLESADLRLDDDIVEEYSEEEAGLVIWQSVEPGETVVRDTRIQVRVSSGTMPERSVSVNIPLPTRAGSGRLTVYLDGVQQFDANVLLLTGNRAVTVSGSGNAVSLQANLDGEQIFTANVNFNQDPPTLSNEQSFVPEPDTRTQIPNVVGQSLSAAYEQLAMAGFTNIAVNHVSPGFLEGLLATSGNVARITPAAGTRHDYDALITLEVYD